jgi:NAD(P)-dependent dehydrogenase (short-subunit alcohol dehydrogenase family)
MQGKVCLVTGANGSVGKATVAGLVRQGATVILACRDQARGEAALAEVKSAANKAQAELLLVDLASQASVRTFAEEFTKRYERLDVLVHNAAIYKQERTLSADGLEMMFATNHLAPFLLTHLLLERLKASAPARVLTVTAPSTTRLNFDDLQGEQRFSALTAFGASKMCNLLFSYELARQLAGSGVTANAVHPGLVKSGLMREAAAPIRWLTSLISAPPEKAAASLVDLASSPAVEGTTGAFFTGKKTIKSNAYSHDESVQRQLWDVSLQLSGLA